MACPRRKFAVVRAHFLGALRQWIWLSALMMGLALTASAQASDAEPLDQIRATMDEGQAQYLKGDYVKAAAVFESGYAAHPYSAFLFNAGVCYQKAAQPASALRAFKSYLDKDPTAPDADAVRARILVLEKELAVARPVEASDEQGPPSGAERGEMKSLVLVETDPPGAPLRVYRKVSPTAAAFDVTRSDHPGWLLVAEPTAPAELTLDVGSYHLVVEKFGEFNQSETDMEVSAGHVHHFKANLSQGAFLGFLKVSANVVGALVYLDDVGSKKVVWGQAPHGELVSPGTHEVRLEAPGFQPRSLQVEVLAGDNKELEVTLERLPIGLVRLDATNDEVTVYEGSRLLGGWRKGEPALEMELSSGPHQLTVVTRGYKDLLTTVDVPQGQIQPVRAVMVKKYPRGVAWSQAILGAAVLGTGIYLGVESDRLARELEAERASGRLRTTDPRFEQGIGYSVGADGCFVLGGTLGLLSLYSFLKDPYPDSELKRGKKLEFERPLPSVAAQTSGVGP